MFRFFFFASLQPSDTSADNNRDNAIDAIAAQMCSKDRDAAGNVAESEGCVRRRHHADVIVIVGVIVRPRRAEAAGVGAEDVGGPGGAEVEEGEGTGERA